MTLIWLLSGRKGRALGWLLVGSDRKRVVIGCCLQVIHTFSACLCWRPWWRILWRILDAFCNRLSDLLIWENGLPVLTSDGRLQSKPEIRKARSSQTLPWWRTFRNFQVMSQLNLFLVAFRWLLLVSCSHVTFVAIFKLFFSDHSRF